MIQEPRSDYDMSTRLERLSNELLNSQELHEIDYITRRNSDVFAAAQGYDLQLQAQLPQRIQQSGVQQYLGSNRRFSSGNMDFYTSARERPVNEMARLPDPLFGAARNTINATPSDFDRERVAVAQHEFDRDRSMTTSDPEYNRSEHIAYAPLDAKSFHASYPEMVYPNIFEDFSLHQQSSIHQTFPDSTFVKRSQGEGDRKRAAKDMEPAQYEQGNFPARRSRKSAVPETFMKKVATNPYPSAGATGTAHSDIHYPSSHHLQSATRMVGGQRISRDLMDCLDKMTYHSIADDNPFEPIPLAPHQEAALNVNRRSSDVSAVDSYHQQSQQHPTIDESERDEFAEG